VTGKNTEIDSSKVKQQNHVSYQVRIDLFEDKLDF